MKIAICGYRNNEYSEGQPDGTVTMIKILSSGLQQLGHEIYNINLNLDSVTLEERKTNLTNGIINVDFFGSKTVEIAQQLIQFFEEKQMDFMAPMNSPILTSIIPYLPKATYVVTWCNSINDHAYFYATAHLDYLSRIVVISPRQKRDLESRWQVKEKKIQLIPLGTEVVNDLPYKNYTNRLQVCYVGRFEEPQKGVHIISKIYNEAKDSGIEFDLELIGDGPERDYLKKIFENQNSVSITETGITREELYLKLQGKHILITPSKFEGFGMVVIEAMMNAVVPIVNSVSGVLDWIVEDNVTGMVRSRKKPKDFSNAVIELCRNRDLLENLAKQARARAVANFSSSEMIKVWEQTLIDIAQTNVKPKPKEFFEYREFKGWRPSITRRLKNLIGLDPKY